MSDIVLRKINAFAGLTDKILEIFPFLLPYFTKKAECKVEFCSEEKHPHINMRTYLVTGKGSSSDQEIALLATNKYFGEYDRYHVLTRQNKKTWVTTFKDIK